MAGSSPLNPGLVMSQYDQAESIGVTAISVAGMLSFLAVLIAGLVILPRTKAYSNTHHEGYFYSLLISNVLQSVGTVMSIRWVKLGGVLGDLYCSFQGGIKQAGNVGNAMWTAAIALHLFNLLFLRWKSGTWAFAIALFLGWVFIFVIVILGPFAIQSPEKGPYFGPSGSWCWITDDYPTAQTMMEYFFEYLSAGTSFILYVIILLRVRGNLTVINNSWVLRWVPREEAWQLSLGRDYLDTAMLQVVKRMIWYPVAYTIILIPISIARLSQFSGAEVPAWAIAVTDVIFNLTGLVNVILLIMILRLYPDTPLPEYSVPRKQITMSIAVRGGVVPFVLSESDVAPPPEKSFQQRRIDRFEAQSILEGRRSGDINPPLAHQRTGSSASRVTNISVETANSFTPLRRPTTPLLSA